ncbi:MAG: hypothetical protein OXC61_03295 [Flavobacteriaceae bacterium]|nr:hypothetical protein [Flavobacteriaceae bacterium]
MKNFFIRLAPLLIFIIVLIHRAFQVFPLWMEEQQLWRIVFFTASISIFFTLVVIAMIRFIKTGKRMDGIEFQPLKRKRWHETSNCWKTWGRKALLTLMGVSFGILLGLASEIIWHAVLLSIAGGLSGFIVGNDFEIKSMPQLNKNQKS